MLELVIDKSLEIDVNIKIQDGGDVVIDDEEGEDPEETGVFEMEGVEEGSAIKKLKSKEDISVHELSDKVWSTCWFDACKVR